MTDTANELPDFDNDDNVAVSNKDDAKADYSAIHAAGFKDFLFKAELNRAIVDCGFEHPSEVQHECIPQAMLGTDILCQAKSGMGKTAVFVLATLQQLDVSECEKTQVVVICHTRELALQIQFEYERFCKHFEGVTVKAMYGGVPRDETVKQLKKKTPTIVVATPGRLKDIVQDKKSGFKLDNCGHFIVDECDKCFTRLEMRKDIQDIFMTTPKKKQVMMFSATMDEAMRGLCKKFMADPHEISVDKDSKLTLTGLIQYHNVLTDSEKNRKLNDLLDELEFNQVVIFVKSPVRAKALDKVLQQCNFPSMCIHSSMPQKLRTEAFKAFKDFKKRVLVATDLFGRGIDIERVNVVVNYDMPNVSDQYLHRVGRAGRFGTKGIAISFVSSDEDKKIFKEIQERFGIEIAQTPDKIDQSTYLNA